MAEEKKKKPEQPPEGFFTNILRPWKRQRVTLTQIGKRAVDGKARVKKTKKSKKPRKTKKGKKAVAKKTASAPATARERQVSELKTLAKIGRRDPERLASIISKMLLDDEEQERDERLRFERLIWEKAEKRGQTGNSGESEG